MLMVVDFGGVKGRPCRQLPFVSDPSTAVSQAHNKVGMINGFFHEERDNFDCCIVLCPDRETIHAAAEAGRTRKRYSSVLTDDVPGNESPWQSQSVSKRFSVCSRYNRFVVVSFSVYLQLICGHDETKKSRKYHVTVSVFHYHCRAPPDQERRIGAV